MKLIELTQGYQTMVDDEDYEYLMQWKWRYWKHPKDKTGYAIRSYRNGKTIRSIRMHRVIMDYISPIIDHKDGNGLNNQRNNLRVATKSQNGANARKRGQNKYKGVTRQVSNNKIYWYARVIKDYKHYVVSANSEQDAVIKYNELAMKYHGEYARLHVIEDKV